MGWETRPDESGAGPNGQQETHPRTRSSAEPADFDPDGKSGPRACSDPTLKRLVVSAARRRNVLLLPNLQSDGRNLARQGEARQFGPHALGDALGVELLQGAGMRQISGGIFEHRLENMIVIGIQTQDERPLPRALEFAVDCPVVRARSRHHQPQAGIGAQAPLAAKAVRSLDDRDQQCGPIRADQKRPY